MATATEWVENKIKEDNDVKILGRTAENLLIVEGKQGHTFYVAVIGNKGIVKDKDVLPLFEFENKPDLVVNLPSNVLWDGAAIDAIHARGAAFGTYGDIYRASKTMDAGSFRNKNMEFFINGIRQHSNVRNVSYVYDSVLRAERFSGDSLTIAVIEAYNMSAEDVRNARARIGSFDIVVKSTSYGSITAQAESAAESMGAKALMYRDLLVWLAR